MATKINYGTKAPFQDKPEIPVSNKVTANDMNEIKEAVNGNADELDTAKEDIENLQRGQGTNNTDITDLKNRVSTLEGDNKTNKTNINNLKTDNETNKSNIQALQKDNTTNKQDISDIKEEQETQNNNIKNLQKNDAQQDTDIEAIKAENERLKEDLKAFPSGQAEGEYITLQDSADSRFNMFRIGGNSKQETRSGKNKFNIAYVGGTIITNKNIETGSFTLQNAWATQIMSKDNVQKDLKPNTQYKCIANVTLISKTENLASPNNSGNLLILYDGKTSIPILKTTSAQDKNDWKEGTTKVLKTTFTTPEDLINFRITGYNYYNGSGGEGAFNFENAMILEATEEDESFEQYGSSPSPEYTSEIRNIYAKNLVGGKWINGLFDPDGTPLYTEANTYRCFRKNLKAGTYVFSYKDSVNLRRIRAVNLTTKGNLTVDNNNSFTIQEDAEISLGFRKTNGTDWDIGENLEDIEFQLEKGNTPTAYFPNGINVTVCNKNLFGGQWITGLYDVNGNLGNTNGVYKCFKKFLKAGTYVYSHNANITIVRYVNLTSKTNLSLNADDKKFTLEEDAEISLGFRKPDSTQWDLGENLADIEFQLEKGSVATDYVEHQEQNVLFPLAQEQKLHLGDYLAEDGIHHVRKQIELDGTEGWSYSDSRKIFAISVNDIALEESFTNSARSIVISSHFKPSNYYNLYYQKVDNAISGHNSAKAIEIRSTEFSSVDEFKAFLAQQKQAGTPVVVEYELATEEIVPYTEEQQKAYEQIVQTAKSYKNVTNIYSPDPVSPIFSINYRKDIETLLTQQNALILEGGN